MLTLYQFPISHYCEKVRWALDYKKLEYEIVNLLPGLHIKKTTKLAKRSSVPVLVHDGKAIQNSADIITYLDDVFTVQPLTPQDAELKQQALDWERYVDEEIGIHLRRVIYHELLEHPAVVIPFFTRNGPWYGPLWITLTYSTLRKRMRTLMDINDATANASMEIVTRAIDKIHMRLQDRQFLVGDQFTRADLAAASLLAPLCTPKKYGLDWPERLPEPIEAMQKELSNKVAWVSKLYAELR